MTTRYAVVGGTRILNSSRVDQSGADDGDVTGWVKTSDFIVAVNINSGTYDTVAAAYRLEWSKNGSSWTALAATGELKFGATVLSNGTALTSSNRRCSQQGGDTWQNGWEVEGTANSGSIDLADEYESELQFSVSPADALNSQIYYFRLYDVTAGSAKATCGAQLTTAAGSSTYNVTSTMAGTSSITVAGKRTANLASTMAGTSSITAVGKRTLNLTSNMAGTSSITVAGTTTGGPIIQIRHEGNDFSEYTSTVTDSGDLSTSASAALAGSNYGLSALIDDTTSIYGVKDLGSSNTSGKLRFRFYFDPNTISMPAWSYATPCRAFDGSGSVILILYWTWTGSVYRVKAGAYNDAAGIDQTAYYDILDGANCIEVLMTKSSGNNGILTLWINDVQKESLTTIDNDTKFASFRYLRVGAEYISSSSISGTVYIDEIVVRDDDTKIGPIGVTRNVTSTMAGTSSITVAGTTYTIHEGATALTGTSTLTVAGSVVHATLEGATSLTGASALTAAAALTHATHEGASALSSTSALVVVGVLTHATLEGTAALAATSVLTVAAGVAHATHEGATTLTGTSTLTVVGFTGAMHEGAATSVGTSSLTSVASVTHVTHEAASVLSGTSNLISQGSVTHVTVEGTASLSSTSQLTSLGSVSHAALEGATTLAGTSQTTTVGSLTHAVLEGSAASAGTSSMSVIGTVVVAPTEGAASLTGTSQLTSQGSTTHAVHEGATSLASTSTLTVVGSYAGTHEGATALVASSTLAPTARVLCRGVASLISESGLTSVGSVAHVTHEASILSVGTSTLVVAGSVTHVVHEGAANLAGTSTIDVIGVLVHATHEGVASLQGTSILTAAGDLVHAVVEGESSLIATTTLVVVGAAGYISTTPDCRIYVVEAETRLYVVPAESRTYVVPQEGRGLSVECSGGSIIPIDTVDIYAYAQLFGTSLLTID